MTSRDEFDLFLADALAPPDRDEDQAFVARVRQRIRIDDSLRAARSAAFERIAIEIAALAAVAAALLWFARSSDAVALAAESPAEVLGAVVALFMMLVWLMAPGTGRNGSAQALS